jgi:DNA-directed RNA polymerase subunit RPC12/RpoP
LLVGRQSASINILISPRSERIPSINPTGNLTVKFKCPSCDMQLKAEPEMFGKVIRCPGCNTKIPVPENPGENPAASGLPIPSGFTPPPADDVWGSDADVPDQPLQPTFAPSFSPAPTAARGGWAEKDPTNPNSLLSFAIGLVLFIAWVGILFPFNPSDKVPVAEYTTMQFVASLFYKHMLVSFTNTLFFHVHRLLEVQKATPSKRGAHARCAAMGNGR